MILTNGRSLAVLVAVLQALTLPVQAAETICDPDQPSHCARPLQKGEEAPFSGQLLSTELSLDLGLKADFCEEKLKLELDFQKKTLGLDLNLERQLRENDRKAWEAERALLIKRLEEAQAGHWYEHPAFVATVTAVLTFLVVLGARETLKALD